jgi:hypothetical protein
MWRSRRPQYNHNLLLLFGTDLKVLFWRAVFQQIERERRTVVERKQLLSFVGGLAYALALTYTAKSTS